MNETVKIFVYGTLKVGGFFAHRFDRVRLSSVEATLYDHALYDLGSFPGVVSSHNGTVHGEVHTFSHGEEVLAKMDYIERYNPHKEKSSLYVRQITTVQTPAGPKEVYLYVFNQPLPAGAKKIMNGIWEI